MGNSQSWKGAISASETTSFTKLQAGFQWLTKSSWDPGQLTSAGRVTGSVSSPEETHSTPEMVLPLRTQETEWLGQTHRSWGVCAHRTPVA